MKYKVNDTVVIYKNTPTYIDGGLAKIIDFTSEDKSYLVANLEDVLRHKGNIISLLEGGKWVAETNLELITFEKKTLKQAFLGFIQAVLQRLKRGK